MFKAAKKRKLSALLEGMRIIREPGYAEKNYLESEYSNQGALLQPRKVFRAELAARGRVRKTNQRYVQHFETLENIGILRRVAMKTVLFFSSYFSTPKSENTHRSIFNGRRLSSHWRTPPNVNLPDTAAIVDRMKKSCRMNPDGLYVVQGDLRHWFHQIKVVETLQRHFGLAMGAQAFLYTTLPMGFSLSPFVAQTLCWFLISYVRMVSRDVILFPEQQFQGEQLPTFVTTATGGWCCTYYDNFIFVTGSKEEAECFAARIKATCDEFSVCIKEGSFQFVTPEAFISAGTSFLGVWYSRRMRDGQSVLVWRASGIEKWRERYPKNFSPTTKREVAQWTGRMLFAHLLRRRPLTVDEDSSALLATMSTNARSVVCEKWDELHQLRPEDLCLLSALWEGVLRTDTEWNVDSDSQASEPPTFVVVCDASATIGGGFHFFRREPDQSLTLLDASQTQNQKNWVDESRHIYLLEMEMATTALESFSRRFPGNRCFLLSDNSAVVWGLRAGYTTNTYGQTMIERIKHLLPLCDIVLVASADNVADCVSRNNFVDYYARLKRTECAVTAHLEGRRIGVKVDSAGRGTSLRSGPPCDEQVVDSYVNTDGCFASPVSDHGSGEEDFCE
jgi:hypothetical protein